ncbi:MAG: PAS domain S-box protein [Candidatus Hermodarchaeota archaeon]
MSKPIDELNKSEIRCFNLINSILDILLELDLDLTITYINTQCFNLLGYKPEEIIGKNLNDFIYPDDKSRIIDIIRNKAISNKGNIHTELRIEHKKGYYIPFSANGSLREYTNPAKIVILLRDITQMKETQQKLMESDKRYREIIENIEDGFFEVDLNGNFTYVNDYTCRYLGISKEDQIGKNFSSFVEKETVKDVFKIFNNVYINNLPKGTFESQAIRSDGERRTFEGSFYLRYDTRGKKIGFYGFTRDITEKKEAEKRLKRSEKQFREAYNRAELYKDLFYHDINNILANIGFSIELSENYLNDPDKESEIKELYEIIKKQFVRGKKLITNVQKLSSLDRTEKSFKTIEVMKILKDTIDLIKGNKRKSTIDISIESFQDEVFIQANDLLIDVFENLLINALNYNNNPSVEILIKISKEVQKDISFIKFEFIDNGIGISDKKKKVIFEERFNKDKGSKGLGFGLTLVKKIIESYGGKIWIEDKVKEDYTKGANFIFSIPVTN